MKWDALEEEPCSLARTVAVIGDRWTLLILRDCFLRVRRFEEFQARLGITRPLLASRLRKLVKDFVLAKVPYQQRPLRYEYRLTADGEALADALRLLADWAARTHGEEPAGALRHAVCGSPLRVRWWCPICEEPVTPSEDEPVLA